MKKLLFVSGMAFLGFATLNVNAQEYRAVPVDQNQSVQQVKQGRKMAKQQKSPEEYAKLKTERLHKMVNLDERQKVKAYEIYFKESKNAQGRAIARSEAQEQINSILNEEQIQKMDEIKSQKKAEMKNRTPRAKGEMQEVRTAPMK